MAAATLSDNDSTMLGIAVLLLVAAAVVVAVAVVVAAKTSGSFIIKLDVSVDYII